ncbi:MAG TPA: amylo-alpha-1,6-glucosidase [Dehalococcoidia bacterium]|nr:amylo-alpha-1,6-glucosidase [Dehalococcoidia bacterium]
MPHTSDHRDGQERPWEHTPDVFGSVEDISDALVIREQSQFLLTDPAGNVTASSRRGLGLYYRDTRHLSVYEFTLDGAYPLVLLSTANSGFTQEQVLGNHRMTQNGNVVGRCTVELRRNRIMGRSLEERLTVTNFNTFDVTIRPAYHFQADFADIFEVRGHQRHTPGHHSPPQVDAKTVSFAYFGADGVWRRTLIAFDQAPQSITAEEVSFELVLKPRQTVELSFRIVVNPQEAEEISDRAGHTQADYDHWHESFAMVHTSNEIFNEVLNRSIGDLRMLWTKDRTGQSYLAAGTPWFATLFGRDSLITSLQTLPFQPEISKHCLALLARHQGQFPDSFHCEEPGKILHEFRDDELSAIGELPYQRYYGSIDSTPLFLLLAAEYFRWTGDTEFLSDLMPAIEAALRWLRDFGDPDRDGFIEYMTDSSDGLRNQGWKDSGEAIMHTDGSLCTGPIALCEVQGYVYAAYTQLVPLLRSLGNEGLAKRLSHDASELRRRFNRAFWLAPERYPAMALDGQKQPSRVMSSNAGQVLWSGILSRERAAEVRGALFGNDMFSGWGVRTLSAETSAYYPLGYHVGTVWPHDNGIVALGLKRYGFDDEVNEIASALFDAAREFPSYRLPELYGGQPRKQYSPPVPYPTACRPQAWTAGAWLHLIQAMLGIVPDAANQRLFVVRPKLPSWLHDVDLQGIAVGTGRVDLHFSQSGGCTRLTTKSEGGVKVQLTSRWPRTAARGGSASLRSRDG